MDIEYWWLLALPLFFALGWLAARIDIKQLVSESRALPLSYFKGLNFPAERAARQGDRGFHRSRQSRSADRRAPFRARQPVPPARRGRARHPHAPEPRRAARSAGRSEARGALRARAGLPQSGLLDRAEELFLKLDGTPHAEAGAQVPARDLPAGEGLAESDRHRGKARIGHGPLAPERDREFLLRARERRDDASRARSPRGLISRRRSRITACACARTFCSAISR